MQTPGGAPDRRKPPATALTWLIAVFALGTILAIVLHLLGFGPAAVISFMTVLAGPATALAFRAGSDLG